MTQPPKSNVTTALQAPGSEGRWHQLQQLRRGLHVAEPWLVAVLAGDLVAEPDLLAALIPRLDRGQVERLLAAATGRDPALLIEAVQQEWCVLASDAAFRQSWLEPLLDRCDQADATSRWAWLRLLGVFRDLRVAALLRQALVGPSLPEAAWPLLPLLGLQRQSPDFALLGRLVSDPGPRQRREQALEGLALGLSAWPQHELVAHLGQLIGDLDASLAAKAVDLLARVPEGPSVLRCCLSQELDPTVQARVQRRLRLSPLVLLVHGRQGGQIPQELQDLAAVLSQRRGSPVVLQLLTADACEPQQAFWSAAQQAGQITLVPLLLLPGGHVRSDLPQIARDWARAARHAGVRLLRKPFLGSWPAWQQRLAAELETRQQGRRQQVAWLHHPLDGELPARFLGHLSRVLGCEPVSAPYRDPLASLQAKSWHNTRLLPLTLAANRLSETLVLQLAETTGALANPEVLPPLLQWPGLREFLVNALIQLP